MAGVGWFVGVVHYALFPAVGPAGMGRLPRAPQRPDDIVVVPANGLPSLVDGGVRSRPPGTGRRRVPASRVAGLAALAAATWALTAAAARLHGRLGDPLDPRAHRALLAVHHARTALWTAHAVLGR